MLLPLDVVHSVGNATPKLREIVPGHDRFGTVVSLSIEVLRTGVKNVSVLVDQRRPMHTVIGFDFTKRKRVFLPWQTCS